MCDLLIESAIASAVLAVIALHFLIFVFVACTTAAKRKKSKQNSRPWSRWERLVQIREEPRGWFEHRLWHPALYLFAAACAGGAAACFFPLDAPNWASYLGCFLSILTLGFSVASAKIMTMSIGRAYGA